MKAFLTVFASVFVAEIGDKTQLATMLFATNDSNGKAVVFFAAAAALVASTAIAVLAGGLVSRLVSPSTLKIVAGLGFIAVGVWTFASSQH